MEVIFLIIGLALGAGIVWLLAKNKMATGSGIPTEQFVALDKQKSILDERLRSTEAENARLQSEVLDEREKANEANISLAKAREVFKAMQDKLDVQKAEVEELQKRLTTEFENIANRILDEKSQKFTEQNRNNLDIILNPLKERIKDFEDKVDKAYKTENDERVTLKTEIKNLVELNKQISEEANNLTNALKGDNKQQGNWGEMLLERVLERSGLVKGSEYTTQFSTTNDDNQRIQPDVIINLPDNKHLVVDSKVSLDGYEKCVNANNEQEREQYAKAHILSIKTHVKNLSEKKYHTAEGIISPEFVLLFLPIESSLSLAVNIDQDIFNYAWDRKIVIVSPTTLLATLRTVASVWKQDRQTRNVLEIAETGGALYDKFVGFIDDMEKINRGITQSQGAYSDAMKKLSEGRGNLVVQTEKLRKLGAKVGKVIPEKFISQSDPFEAEIVNE